MVRDRYQFGGRQTGVLETKYLLLLDEGDFGRGKIRLFCKSGQEVSGVTVALLLARDDRLLVERKGANV